jgi:hypothetical protein
MMQKGSTPISVSRRFRFRRTCAMILPELVEARDRFDPS